MKRPKLSRVLLVLAALGLAIQLVPYGWNHANPVVAALTAFAARWAALRAFASQRSGQAGDELGSLGR